MREVVISILAVQLVMHSHHTYTSEKENNQILTQIIDPTLDIQERLSLITKYPQEHLDVCLVEYLHHHPAQDNIYPNIIIDYFFSHNISLLGNRMTMDGKRFPNFFHYIVSNALNKSVVNSSPEEGKKIIDNLLYMTELCLEAYWKYHDQKDLITLLLVFKRINNHRMHKIPKVLIHEISNYFLLSKKGIKNITKALNTLCMVKKPNIPFEYIKANVNGSCYFSQEDKNEYLYNIRFLNAQEWKNNSIFMIKHIRADLDKQNKKLSAKEHKLDL